MIFLLIWHEINPIQMLVTEEWAVCMLFFIGDHVVLIVQVRMQKKLLQFKRWFWSIVEKMTMTERQDLVKTSLFSSSQY